MTAGEPTVRCWRCGQRVPETKARRRNVRSGGLLGGAGRLSGGSPVLFGAGQWSREDLCEACAAQHDAARAARRRLLWLVVAALAAALVALLLWGLATGKLR
jgi:hypothetical protein